MREFCKEGNVAGRTILHAENADVCNEMMNVQNESLHAKPQWWKHHTLCKYIYENKKCTKNFQLQFN